MLYWRKVHAMRPHSSRILSRFDERFHELTIALDLPRDMQAAYKWESRLHCWTR